jgi:outer membrane protein
MRQKRKALFFCFLTVLMGSLYTGGPCHADETTIGLEQIVELAVRRNPDIEFSRQASEEARARITQSESGYFPRISAGTGYDRKGDVIRSLDGVSIHERDRYNSYTGDITVTQTLYDFGRTAGRAEESRHAYESSKKGIHKTHSEIIRETKTAYYEVLKKRRLIKVNHESLQIQQKHLERAEALHKVGLRPKIDVTKAQLELAQRQESYTSARFDYQSAKVDLESILGGPPIQGAYRLEDVTGPEVKPEPLEYLIKEALEARPELDELDSQILAAESRLKAAFGEYFPVLSLNGTYQLENQETPLNTHWDVGVRMDWTFFSGLSTRGQVSEIRASILKLKASRRKTELTVTKEVSQALIDTNKARKNMEIARMSLKEAEENMEIADGRYHSGVGNAIEYSDAELNLTQSRSLVVQATYEYLQSLATLDYAVGRY